MTAGQGQVSRDQQGLVMRELIRHLVHVVSRQAPRGGGEEAAAPAWSSHTVSFMEICSPPRPSLVSLSLLEPEEDAISLS